MAGLGQALKDDVMLKNIKRFVEEKRQLIFGMDSENLPIHMIAKLMKISEEDVEAILGGGDAFEVLGEQILQKFKNGDVEGSNVSSEQRNDSFDKMSLF